MTSRMTSSTTSSNSISQSCIWFFATVAP
uniref:Uncharacterized protein n=1 Tax=Rhizophora mucronata TaxID=61149 RepID=A0A2P2INT9_RHIMU